MSDEYAAHVRDALRAVAFHKPPAYSWNGRLSAPLAPAVKRKLTADATRAYLLYQLQSALYGEFYVRGGALPEPSGWAGAGHAADAAAFGAALSAANSGGGCWDAGWQVMSAAAEEVVATKNGLTLRAPGGAWRAAGPEAGSPGSAVALRMPKEMLGVSPGYYMCLGDADAGAAPPGTLLRIYWNMAAAGAVPLVRAMSEGMNRGGLPFKAKVLADPFHYTRCDAAVVYFPARHYAAAADVLINAHGAVRGHLRPETPVFTRRLAPGVGLAEDPDTGESFGQHRCRVLAEGLLLAHEQRARSPAEGVRVVSECFARAGLSLDAPYLNAASHDPYPKTLAR